MRTYRIPPAPRMKMQTHSWSRKFLAEFTGTFVVLLDHDDTLAPEALLAIARHLREHPADDLIYSDEDKLDEVGERCEPAFKPDWSPDLLRAWMYRPFWCTTLITHLDIRPVYFLILTTIACITTRSPSTLILSFYYLYPCI